MGSTFDCLLYWGVANDNKSPSWRYDKGAGWEQDFLFNEFLDERRLTVVPFLPSEIRKLVVRDRSKKRVLVFSSNVCGFEDVRWAVEAMEPDVVFHMSDEFGDRPQYDELSDLCSLYFRQYRHRYKDNERVRFIPLGYNLGMFRGSCLGVPMVKSSDRFLNWSFVGKMKSDRHEMINHFSRIPHGFVGNMEGPAMRATYSQSKFVPVGRGNVSLNCFRIYEAVSCGAIPVVAGPREEMSNTFRDEGEYPWVTAESWASAAAICMELVGDEDRMNALQRINLDWWSRRINDMRMVLWNILPDFSTPDLQI